MVAGAEYIYNQFDDGKDVHFYMAPDKINALTVGHITRSSQHDAILACQDSQLRVIQVPTLTSFAQHSLVVTVHIGICFICYLSSYVQDSDCVLEASVEGPATAVEVYEPSLQFGGGGGGGGGASNRLLYGTRKGHVGMMHVSDAAVMAVALSEPHLRTTHTCPAHSSTPVQTDSDTVRPVWVHHRSGPTMEGEGRGTSQVTAITSYDLTKDGVSEVVVWKSCCLF